MRLTLRFAREFGFTILFTAAFAIFSLFAFSTSALAQQELTSSVNVAKGTRAVIKCRGQQSKPVTVRFGKKRYSLRFGRNGEASVDLRAVFKEKGALRGALTIIGGNSCSGVTGSGRSQKSLKFVAKKVVTPTPTSSPTSGARSIADDGAGDGSTPTASPDPTATATPTSTPTATPIATATSTPAADETPTASPSVTPTATATPSATPTAVPTSTPIPTATVPPTATPTATPTAAPRACEAGPVDQTASITSTVVSETSTLDRVTRELISTVVVTIKNVSSEALVGPGLLNVRLRFPVAANAGPVKLNGVQMTGTPPGDLTAELPFTGLASQETIQLTYVFKRASAVRFTYATEVFARCPASGNETSGPPVIEVPQENYTVGQGQLLEFPVIATDPDDDRVALTGGPKLLNCTFTSSPRVNPTGTFRFTPGAGQKGQFDFNFIARDASGLSATKTVRVLVTQPNTAPVITGPAMVQVTAGDTLRLPLTVTDQDQDILTIAAENVPQNAVFVEASRTLAFVPSDAQIGVFTPTFVASDGTDVSPTYAPQITVVPRAGGEGGGPPPALELLVNQISSPVLGTSVRVSGSVNTALELPPAQQSVKLITGVVPATGEQGKSVTVELTGLNTTFADGVSRADFGDGVTVDSISVLSPTTARVILQVSSRAALGPRSVQVQSAEESAVSVVAFNILPGKTSIKGILKDPESGAPIAGARLTLEGTNFTVVSGLDGSFEFFDAPSGALTLIVNSPNRDLQRVQVDSESGQLVDLGTFGSPSLVYDPGSAPSASVASVLGRGAGDLTNRLSFEEAKQVVIDAIIATGGNEGGALDEFGNQLNPAVSGNGLISAPNSLVEDQAFQLMKGEFRPLYEYLLGFSFAFEWQPGQRPTLPQWIRAIQARVNSAWQEPNKPENRIVVLIFNQGRTVGPVPPTITAETSLSAVQAYLLTSSWLAYSSKVAPQFASNSLMDRFGDLLISNAYAQAQSPTPPPTGQISSLTDWYKDITTDSFNEAYKGKVVDAIGGGGAFGAVVLNSMGKTAAVPGLDGISSAIVGGFADVLTGYLVKLNLIALTPRPPLILEAEKITETFAGVEERDVAVVLRTTRTYGDDGAANPPGKRFIYRLWRQNAGILERIAIGPIPERRKNDDPAGGPFLDPADPHKFIFLDYAPKDGHNVYYVDVERSIGEDPYNNPPDLPMWTKFLPQPSFGISSMPMLGSFNPVGTLTAVMGPMQSLANGIRRMQSPMSSPKAIWIGKGLRASSVPAGGLEIDPNTREVYVSYPSESRVDVLNIETLQRTGSFDPGFKAPPAQSGLAVNSDGDLFSENAASDASFGGKIFKYDSGTFARSHVGMTNYYSFLLGYARATAVSAMCMAPDENLYVLDSVDQQVKKVAVTHTYDPYRRVGQPTLYGPLYAGIGGAGTDMASNYLDQVFITNNNNVIVGDAFNNTSQNLFSASLPFQTIRSVTFDGMHNMYLAGAAYNLQGGGTTEGIAMLTPAMQRTWFNEQDPTHCKFDKYLFMRGLQNAGLTRVHPNGQTIVFLDNGVPRFQGFGVSGQIVDTAGLPLSGALVSVGGADFAASKPSKTNSCGTFHILNLVDPVLRSRTVELTISTADRGAMKVLVGLDNYGQSIRDIVFNPPVVPDEDIDPPPFEDWIPPPPIPTEVTIDFPDPVVVPIDIKTEPEPIKEEETPYPAQIITILSPLDLQKTSSTSGRVKGFVDDDRVTSVYVAANGVELEVPVTNQRFEADVTLGAGMNYIVARVALADGLSTVVGYSPRVRVEVDPTATGTGNVVGQVVDQTTGRAIAAVKVRLTATDEMVLTDVHGVYEFRDVPLGQTTVELVENEGETPAP